MIKTRGNQTEAAKMLGISRSGLGGILKRVGR
ncbi:helix-turn-helix domain-containing protein [Escherichia coli]